MAERKAGAGSRLSGVLERSTPRDAPAPPDADEAEPVTPQPADSGAGSSEGEPAPAARGRGALGRRPKTAEARAAKRIKGRTIYLHDDLFERIIVQAHRRGRTISEYVAAVLERQVPDHRVVRTEHGEPPKSDVA